MLLVIYSRLTLDGLAAFKFLLSLKFSHIFAILRAHFSFYARLPKLLKLRKTLTQNTVKYYKTKSVVWSYFASRKKHFTDL